MSFDEFKRWLFLNLYMRMSRTDLQPVTKWFQRVGHEHQDDVSRCLNTPEFFVFARKYHRLITSKNLN